MTLFWFCLAKILSLLGNPYSKNPFKTLGFLSFLFCLSHFWAFTYSLLPLVSNITTFFQICSLFTFYPSSLFSVSRLATKSDQRMLPYSIFGLYKFFSSVSPLRFSIAWFLVKKKSTSHRSDSLEGTAESFLQTQQSQSAS